MQLIFVPFSIKSQGPKPTARVLGSGPSGAPDNSSFTFILEEILSSLQPLLIYYRQCIQALLQVFVGWNHVSHDSIVELLISLEIEVSGSG